MRPQLILTTHAPLVLASMEPHFKPGKDKLFLFELNEREVTLRELPWTKRGDLAALPEGLRTEDEIHRELVRVLPDQDRFWPRWIVRRERKGA